MKKERFKKLREAAQLTQTEAAKLLGISPSTISMWETSDSKPKSTMLPKVAETYGCKISDFYD